MNSYFEANAKVSVITNNKDFQIKVREILSQNGYDFSEEIEEKAPNGTRVISIFRKTFHVPYKENLRSKVEDDISEIIARNNISIEYDIGDMEEKDFNILFDIGKLSSI